MKLSLFLKRTFYSLISLHTACCEGANCLERLGELTGEGIVIIFKICRYIFWEETLLFSCSCIYSLPRLHAQCDSPIPSPPIHLVPLLSTVLLFWKKSLTIACLLGWGQGKSTKLGLGCGRCLQSLCYLIGHSGIKRVRPGTYQRMSVSWRLSQWIELAAGPAPSTIKMQLLHFYESHIQRQLSLGGFWSNSAFYKHTPRTLCYKSVTEQAQSLGLWLLTQAVSARWASILVRSL